MACRTVVVACSRYTSRGELTFSPLASPTPRFGIHSLSSEFLAIEADLFVKYSQQVSTLQLQWQKRILKNENSHTINTIHDGSKISSWPEDLIGCVGLQLQLAITRLQGNNIEKVCCLCVGLLERYQTELSQKFDDEGGVDELSVERMCVFSNDCFRFADLLQEQGGIVDNLTPEAAEKVSEKISDVIMLFSSLSNRALEGIVGVMCTDIEEELKATVFGQRDGGLGDLKEMLRSCGTDIKLWMCDESLVGVVLKKSLHRVVKCYLEVLLNSKPKLDEGGALLRQIREDGEVFEGLFEEFGDLMPSYLMERELEVLKQVLQLCTCDAEMIVDFWMSKLVKSFGSSSTRVVECALMMRQDGIETSKGVVQQLKIAKVSFGNDLIHDEKSPYLLNLVALRERKRDIIYQKTLGKRGSTRGGAGGVGGFVVRRGSSIGKEEEERVRRQALEEADIDGKLEGDGGDEEGEEEDMDLGLDVKLR